MAEKAHSEEYIHAESRDYWYNKDFFELIISRFKLNGIESIADIGCGNGYMLLKFIKHISSVKNVFGLDREKIFLEEAAEKITALNKKIKYRFECGEAEKIPLPDNSVDLAVCQTLLIHVKDPKAVISEMIRITKPGGIVLALEPNNLTQASIKTKYIGEKDFSIEKIMHGIEYMLRIEKGKEVLGEGDNSLGDLVPLLFSELGLQNIHVYLNDKTIPIIPPYSLEAQSVIDDEISWIQNGESLSNYSDMKRYYLASGGEIEKFEESWKVSIEDSKKHIKFCEEQKYYSAGSSMFYIIGGIKK